MTEKRSKDNKEKLRSYTQADRNLIYIFTSEICACSRYLRHYKKSSVGKNHISLVKYFTPQDIKTCKTIGLKVIKLFSCSTQLSTKFQLVIKTKIPTNEEVSCFKSLKCFIYHILTFMSRINSVLS